MIIMKCWSWNSEIPMILYRYDTTLNSWVLKELALFYLYITILMSKEYSSVKSKVINKCAVDYFSIWIFEICQYYTSSWDCVCSIEYRFIYKKFAISFYCEHSNFPRVIFRESTAMYLYFCRIVLKFDINSLNQNLSLRVLIKLRISNKQRISLALLSGYQITSVSKVIISKWWIHDSYLSRYLISKKIYLKYCWLIKEIVWFQSGINNIKIKEVLIICDTIITKIFEQ